MPDIYVTIGAMTHSDDTSKVPLSYRPLVSKTMKAAAAESLKGAEGFTTEAPKNGEGYEVSLTLTEIITGFTVQDRPGVKCNLNGTIFSVPAKLLITKSLTGTGTAGGAGTRITESDVEYCLTEAVKKTMTKSVMPKLKEQKKP